MKKILVFTGIVSLVFVVAISSRASENVEMPSPKANEVTERLSDNSVVSGHTYKNGGETLDFYSNGTVVYKAQNSSVSRRGDYTIGNSCYYGRQPAYTISVKIYVGERTVTLSGKVLKTGSQMVLNDNTWNKIY